MKKILFFVVMVSGLVLPAYCFAQPDRSEEVAGLLAGIESVSQSQRVNAAKIIFRSGLQDVALYRSIASILKDGYTQPFEKDHADEMAWMCKALAASGDMQYRSLLDEIAKKAPSVKIQRYAKQSSALLDQYAQRSKILNATDNWDSDLSAEDNRLISMLQSDDFGLRRDAAKMIVRNVNTDAKVFAATATTLRQMAESIQQKTIYVDTLAWLCKALAASGDAHFIKDLEHLHDTTSNYKLKSYAKKAINALH